MAKRRYTILCACGSSIATSTIVAAKVDELLKQHNIEAVIKKTTYGEMENAVAMYKPDLVMTSSMVKTDLGVPVLLGIPYLTGIGKAELNKAILEILAKLD